MPELLGWARRTDVQRVDLYTRGSLHVIFWFLLALATLSAVGELDRVRDMAVVVLLAALLGALGSRLVRVATGLYPDHGPLPWRRIALLGLVAAAASAWSLALPPDARFGPTLIVTGTLGWGLGGFRDRRVMIGLVAAGALAVGLPSLSLGLALYGAAMAGFFAFTVQSSLWLLGVVTELDRARTSQAALAVAEERLRFSRDVHDVLGRHLSTIAVQAELAATLAERGDERVPGMVREIRGTAHDALREARELARGYRPLDLDQELEGAVSLLGSAGITARADLGGLPPEWAAPVARVVREAVTNVLRHSAATRVEIGYHARTLEVRNDGVLAAPDPHGDGSGLRSLADELAGLGAALEHGPVPGQDGDEFVVRLRLGEGVPA